MLTYLQEEHPQTIALVLAHMSPDQAAMILSALPESMQSDIAHRIATMERTSPEVVRQLEMVLERKELAVALKGVRGDVRDKILNNMSERAAANLSEEIDLLGPVRMKRVGEAQGAVVKVIRQLEESGQLVLSRGNEEMVL